MLAERRSTFNACTCVWRRPGTVGQVEAGPARFTARDLESEFPDEAACLAAIVRMRYPEGIECPACDRVTRHHPVTGRTCYECQHCGHQEYPMKGTIFERSTTPLRTWFRAIYMVAASDGAPSTSDAARRLGVDYRTAKRMLTRIRSLSA